MPRPPERGGELIGRLQGRGLPFLVTIGPCGPHGAFVCTHSDGDCSQLVEPIWSLELWVDERVEEVEDDGSHLAIVPLQRRRGCRDT